MLIPRPIYCPNVILFDQGDNSSFPVEEAKSLIKKFIQSNKIITVYITHNFADLGEMQIVVKGADYAIYKETRLQSNCITSEFLKAGSSYVYFIKAHVDSYRTAFIHFYDILSGTYPIICVSKNLAFQLQAAAIVFSNNTSANYRNEFHVKALHESPQYTSNEILEQRLQFLDKKIIIS